MFNNQNSIFNIQYSPLQGGGGAVSVLSPATVANETRWRARIVYCHLSRRWVKEGDKVMGGQLLGITGNSGETTAPHLHFGMRWKGQNINPQEMIEEVLRQGLN
jgi:hypothetical protein